MDARVADDDDVDFTKEPTEVCSSRGASEAVRIQRGGRKRFSSAFRLRSVLPGSGSKSSSFCMCVFEFFDIIESTGSSCLTVIR